MNKDEAIAWVKRCEDRAALHELLNAVKDRLFTLTHDDPYGAGVGNRGKPFGGEIPGYSGPRP